MAQSKKSIVDRYYWSIEKYGYRDIFQAYKRPSVEKIEAFEHIRELYCNDDSGYGLTVISSNTYCYSVGYLCYIDNKLCLKYFTAYKCYIYELE